MIYDLAQFESDEQGRQIAKPVAISDWAASESHQGELHTVKCIFEVVDVAKWLRDETIEHLANPRGASTCRS